MIKNLIVPDETFFSELEEVLFCLYTDCQLALSGDWDRSDKGFQSMKYLIQDFADRYNLSLENTRPEILTEDDKKDKEDDFSGI